jgi:molecular chaperone GrpE
MTREQQSNETDTEAEERIQDPAEEQQTVEAVDGTVVEAATETSDADLQRELARVKAELDERLAQLMRAQADCDNQRRRHERELENAHKFGLENFVSEMLGVWDSLELGLQAAQGGDVDVGKLREGTELTLKLLVDAMRKFDVVQVDPQGEAFNPEFHQAISMQPAEGVEANTVINVVQKGYTLHGRLVRPAMVVVAGG